MALRFPLTASCVGRVVSPEMAEVKSAIADLLCNDLARVLIAGVLLVGSFALLLSDKPVPDVVWALDGAAVSFYFSLSIAKQAGNGYR